MNVLMKMWLAAHWDERQWKQAESAATMRSIEWHRAKLASKTTTEEWNMCMSLMGVHSIGETSEERDNRLSDALNGVIAWCRAQKYFLLYREEDKARFFAFKKKLHGREKRAAQRAEEE